VDVSKGSYGKHFNVFHHRTPVAGFGINSVQLSILVAFQRDLVSTLPYNRQIMFILKV
jgi:hypothetical protein